MNRERWQHLFPYEEIRSEQELAINSALEALYEKDVTTFIAECGTGVGKSAIAMTVARFVAENLLRGGDIEDPTKAAYIITSQKILQDQYADEWQGTPDGLVDLRASNNFKCSWSGAETCAETLRVTRSLGGDLRVPGAPTCGGGRDARCPYKARKEAFCDSHVGTTNYSYLLNESTYAGSLKQREILILDECHGIEDVVKRWSTITVKRNSLEELGITTWPGPTRADADGWLEYVYKPSVASVIAETVAKIEKLMLKKGSATNPTLRRLSARNEQLDKHLCGLNRYLEGIAGKRGEYLILRSGEAEEAVLEVKPINVTKESAQSLYGLGKKHLLLSATVLDKEVFMRSAGLATDHGSQNVGFISIPTPFPPKSYGITFCPVGRMTRRDGDATAPTMVAAIKKILAKHPKEKGIIHTASYAITRMLEKIGDKRLLIQRTSDDREGMLDRHKRSKLPTVLVSPAMVEGIDLKDDLGRIQVLCKVPYPYIGDDVVQKKMQLDPRWYAWCTVRTIVQAVGRCVRNEDDWTRTYILDTCFGDLVQRYGDMLPDHFSDMEMVDNLLAQPLAENEEQVHPGVISTSR